MPLVQTRGAASAQGFGEFAQATAVNYIEDMFSTYLYTPATSNTAINIPNGIDLSTKGGMVWFKKRTGGTQNHSLVDTVRGGTDLLTPNDTAAAYTANIISSFNNNGFTTGISSFVSVGAADFVSWTFRKQPKFFDVVGGLTSDGSGNLPAFNHSLGSIPGCVFLKATNSGSNWVVYHRGLSSSGANQYIYLNSTDAAANSTGAFVATSSTFQVASGSLLVPSVTYVAYLFAHNAGGFGLTGADNVISCGSTTANGSGDFSVNLGYEPQWVLLKSTGSGRWSLFDNMRGVTASSGYTSSKRLQPQASDAEDQFDAPYGLGVNATGFTGNLATFSNDFIYIAIRRGPMKVPTVGTSVFAIGGSAISGSSTLTTSFAVDAFIENSLSSSASNSRFCSRLQGSNLRLVTSSTDAEAADNGDSQFGGASYKVTGANGGVVYGFGRAPGFFDEVCYTGTGASATFNHNLTVTPEIIIIKNRSNVQNWGFWHKDLYPTYASSAILFLNVTNIAGSGYMGTPTSSTFSFATGNGIVNGSGNTYVAYLFATCAGVSKVSSYTGNGTTQTIDCGFTGGARFVLIRRIDTTGDWYVWDSARGIVAGNDPYLLLNSTAAQVTGTDYVDTYNAGFEISSTAPAAINANGGTFIFLAIA